MIALKGLPLSELVRGLSGVSVVGDVGSFVSGIACDSRNVKHGDLFVAVPGTKQDGKVYIPKALEAGAGAVLASSANGSSPVPVVVAEDVRLAMGRLAARLFQHPDQGMEIIGITGTNGKTTITYLLESILRVAGMKPGVIGTVNYRFGSSIKPANTTTPESVDIFQMLSDMKEEGATHVAMEISSHALDQKRVSGLRIRRAVFTNLSRDHLDYHADFEEYFAAKRKLFTEVIEGKWAADLPKGDARPAAAVNLDDPYGRRLYEELKAAGIRCLGYSARDPSAEVRAEDISLSDRGITARAIGPGCEIALRSDLVGAHNVENILAAVALCLTLGISGEAIERGVQELHSVPGRLEPVVNGAGITVLVDYAHTPDALEHAVDTCREVARGKLVTVFGCGGDRDPGKRPLMGAIAVKGSDLAIVTSDNPRTEDPNDILGQILAGIREVGADEIGAEAAGAVEKRTGATTGKYLAEPDRRKAIGLAIKIARPGDIVLIAGKGHEDYQILGTEKIHFDDREEAAKALEGREGK